MSSQVHFTKYSKKRAVMQTGILKSYKYRAKAIAVSRMNATNNRLSQILPENLMIDERSTPPLAFLLREIRPTNRGTVLSLQTSRKRHVLPIRGRRNTMSSSYRFSYKGAPCVNYLGLLRPVNNTQDSHNQEQLSY
jgi:hypothetical protein